VSRANKPPILIEWSPQWVRVFDPISRSTMTGASLRACVSAEHSGRDAVIAISQRSAFIRQLPVPSAKPDDLHKLILLNVAPLLPLKSEEAIIGYRVPQGLTGKAKVAVVGAAKLEAIQTIYKEAKELGLKVQAVLPIAFASWAVAQELKFGDCAVVTCSDKLLNIDLISGGELAYSRTISGSESPAELAKQVAGTFRIANLSPGPILTAPNIEIKDSISLDREPLESLANIGLVKKQLFSFNLPSKADQREASSQVAAVRALAALTAAVGLAAYVFLVLPPSKLAPSHQDEMALKIALQKESSVEAKNALITEAANVLDIAFAPAQSFTDVLAVAADTTASTSWLTGATVERGKPVLIRGHAQSGKDVAKYVQDLARQDRFRSVKLVSAANATIGKQQYVQFVISAYALGLKPLPKPKKTGGKK
jgi:Fimbrial assembly protein (PilN)